MQYVSVRNMVWYISVGTSLAGLNPLWCAPRPVAGETKPYVLDLGRGTRTAAPRCAATRCPKCDHKQVPQTPAMSPDQKVDFALAHVANMVNCGINISQNHQDSANCVSNGLAAIMSLVSMIRELPRSSYLLHEDIGQHLRVPHAVGMLVVRVKATPKYNGRLASTRAARWQTSNA